MFGLILNDLQVILDTLKLYPQIDKAFIFDSRALNTYKEGSDVDIALKGKNIGLIANTISGILNEKSALPYFFDILDYDLIMNQDLKEHIDQVG